MGDERRPTSPGSPSVGWLVMAHALLCLSQLLMHSARYPIDQSLYFWWISPLDLFALGGITLLYLKAARWGFCLNTLVAGIECTALFYLGLKTVTLPPGLQSPGMSAFYSAAAVLARIPIGGFIAVAVQPSRPPPRGCAP